MASIPQIPEGIHQKSSSPGSTRSLRLQSSNDREPAGRPLYRLKTNLREQRSGVELFPKPSDDPKDPLNWPTYKKELAYCSILLSSAVVGMIKTLYVSTNGVLATQYGVSYVAATALTGVPFIFAALFGVCATIFAAVIGKRILYIGGGLLMLVGALWNMHVGNSYAQFMVSRIFQGVGWGITDALVNDTIRDLFFVHELKTRYNIYTLTSLIFTWGSPILGGYLSQSSESFRNEIMVVTIIQAFSVFFFCVLVPETAFDRIAWIPAAIPSAPTSAIKNYLDTLKPVPYRNSFSLRGAFQPIRALGAPTAILTFLLTFPITASAHAFAQTLSLLLATMPTFLFPSRLGFLFILPLIFSLLAFSLLFVAKWLQARNSRPWTTSSNMLATFVGILLGVTGLLSFGLYVSGELSPRVLQDDEVSALSLQIREINLNVVSVLFGMLVAASVVVTCSASSQISLQTGELPSENKSLHLLEGSYHFWQSIFTGMFIVAVPAWIEIPDGGNELMTGLHSTVLGIFVTTLVLSSTAGAIFWVRGPEMGKIDARVLGIERPGVGGSSGLRRWNSKQSFFDEA